MIRLMLIASTLAGLLLAGCQGNKAPIDFSKIAGGVSDEEKVAIVLADVKRGLESKRIYQVLAHVSPNYSDREGRNYEALRDYLTTILDNYRDIRITRTPPSIQVQGDRARIVDSFGTLAQPEDARKYPLVDMQGRVVILMERAGDTWKIIEWGPLF